MRYVTGFGRFWWNVSIGDDWRIAAAVLITLAAAGQWAARSRCRRSLRASCR
jgi:hypothetical protein